MYFLTGIPDRVEFSPLEGRKEIVANADLELCAGSCDVKKVVATATLMTGHIGKGCDRNTYSLHSQRKLCGKTLCLLEVIVVLQSGLSGALVFCL